MFGHSMFGVFEVQYFGVRSKTNCNSLGQWFKKIEAMAIDYY